jgi:branched-chain amino acid transport system permease protein
MNYWLHLLILVCIYSSFAQSHNLLFGLTGQLNLAHISSFALGAYTTAILSTYHNNSMFSCLVASMFIGGIFSLFIFFISSRLHDDRFSLATLALSLLLSVIFINYREVTNGVFGIASIPRPVVFNIEILNNLNFLCIIAPFSFIILGINYVLFSNRFARVNKAIAENCEVVLGLGVNPKQYLFASILCSSIFAATTGAFYAWYVSYIDPSSFSFSETVLIITINVLGGIGFFWGNVIAAIFLVLLPELLTFLPLDSSYIGPIRQILYGSLLFIVIALSSRFNSVKLRAV